MPHHVGADLQLHQNQLLGARLEALTALPTAPRQGRVFYLSSALTAYDGVSFQTRMGMAMVLNATSIAQYRMWGGINQPENVTGLWTFCPSQTGSITVGLATLPPAPAIPQAIGGFKPFIISGQSRLFTGFEVTPDTDGAGDLAQPGTGLKRYVPNWIQHLGADLVDGYHATVVVTAYGIPVRVLGGQLRVPLDPLEADHATSRQYVDRRRGRLRSRTPVDLRTTTALPAYTFDGTAVYTASANGALTVDGVAVTVNQRIMVATETNATRNWIMKVTATGAAGAPWVLRYVADKGGYGDTEPDGQGAYDYGDYFSVTAGATHTGTTWVMSGSPTEGGGGQPPPGEEVFFNTLQLSPPLSAGHGITVLTGKIHFWKSSYAGILNTFPYLLADVDGQGAIGSMAIYEAASAFILKSTNAGRMPKRSALATAIFQDSGVADDGAGFYPDVTRTLGISTKVWSELWAVAATSATKLANVYGSLATSQLQARTWANFTSDLVTDLNLGLYALKATTITITGSGGIVITGLGTQSLAANMSWDVGLGTIPSTSVTLPANAVGYGSASSQLTGDAAQFFFNSVYVGIANKLNLGAVTAPAHRLDFAPGSTTVAPIRFTAPSALLTIPVAGVFETDLNPSIRRASLFFTDGVPLRHALMFRDDVNLTNDAVARPNGGIGFYGDVGSVNFLIAKLDGEIIGYGDFALLLRFLYPATTAAQINYGLFSLTSSTTGATGPFDLTGFMVGTAGAPEFRLGIRNEAGSLTGATWILPDMSRPGGKVVDFLISRVAGVITIYLDGVNVTPIPTGASYQASPIAGGGAILRFHLGNMHTAVMPAHTDFYRASLFNRGFATEDEAKFLSRYGIAAADLWGSSTDLLGGAGGFETLAGWTVTQPAGATVALTTVPANVYSGASALAVASPGDASMTGVTRAAVLGVPGKRIRYEWKAKKDAASSDPTSVQVSYGGAGFAKAVPITTGTTYGTYASEGVWEAPPAGLAFTRATGQASKTFFIDAAVVRQVGALVDLDLGVGRGTIVPDRSSRYPAILNGSHFIHLVPYPVSSGDGTYSGIQKFQTTILARDNDSKDVVHSLGTTGISVDVWDSQNRHVGVSVTRKAGNEANAVTLTFNVFGSPSVDQSFTVIIMG